MITRSVDTPVHMSVASTRRSADKRDDATYRIEALEKGIAVIEALEGVAFEPVRIDRIVERCRLPKNTVFRTLRTLRHLGWAVRNERGEWMIGGRLARFAAKAAQTDQVSAART